MSSTKELLAHLQRAARAAAARRVELNAVARGEAVLEHRDQHIAWNREINRLLEEIGDGIYERQRIVRVDDVGSREKPPQPLLEAYEHLCIAAYGSDPAVSVGDANVIQGVGKRETRTTSGQPENRAPGAPPATKKFGQGNRNVIKSRKAYEMKVKVDRRMRRYAKEIREFLEGEEHSFTVNVCSHCARIGEDDWKWCPNCGHEMRIEERE